MADRGRRAFQICPAMQLNKIAVAHLRPSCTTVGRNVAVQPRDRDKIRSARCAGAASPVSSFGPHSSRVCRPPSRQGALWTHLPLRRHIADHSGRSRSGMGEPVQGCSIHYCRGLRARRRKISRPHARNVFRWIAWVARQLLAARTFVATVFGIRSKLVGPAENPVRSLPGCQKQRTTNGIDWSGFCMRRVSTS